MPRAMRVTRTFGFVDLVGFTTYTASEGDEAAMAALVGLRSLLRRIAPDRGVRIAKWLGDGAMLVGVEAEPLVGAILDLHAAVACDPDRTLPVRAGAVEGRVLLCEGDDHAGMAVNLAARLGDAAAPGELWVPDELADRVALPARRRGVGPVAVRGVDHRVAVTALAPLEPAGTGSSSPAPAGVHP